MVDQGVLAARIASVRDAVDRIRSVLPVDASAADRTVREVVVLNLFVAVQSCLALAAHWLSDTGGKVPASYRDSILALADQGVIDRELAERVAAAAGLRNLVAHGYATLDWMRVHEIASTRLDDLLDFCEARASAVAEGRG